jgi:hypothetical protein
VVHRSDGQLRLFHFIQRLVSGGGCISLKLRQKLVLRRQARAAHAFRHGKEEEAAADRHADRRAPMAAVEGEKAGTERVRSPEAVEMRPMSEVPLRGPLMTDMCNLILERYGWPGEPGQLKQPPNHRVKALRWQLERFAELVHFDPSLAGAAMNGQKDFHKAMMIMRLKTGQYRAERGDALLAVDQFIRRQLDQTENVKR